MFLGLFATVCVVAFVRDIVPSGLSATYVFNDALKIVIQDPDVQRCLGPNIKGYGQEYGGTRAGRRNQIEHFIFEDEDGMKQCRIKLTGQEKRGKGVA